MKKLFILSMVALSATAVSAQRLKTRSCTTQGNWALRLGLGFNSSKDDLPGDATNKSMDYMVNPSLGYFVSDNLEVGVEVNVNNTKTESVVTTNPLYKITNTQPTTAFNIYGMKYFPVNNWFSFTGKAMLGLGFGNFTQKQITGSTSYEDPSANGTLSNFGGGISAGFGFTPINNFAISTTLASLGVNSITRDPKGTNDITKTTNINFATIANNANIGVVWYFGRKLKD